jgi:hypothetical protein
VEKSFLFGFREILREREEKTEKEKEKQYKSNGLAIELGSVGQCNGKLDPLCVILVSQRKRKKNPTDVLSHIMRNIRILVCCYFVFLYFLGNQTE